MSQMPSMRILVFIMGVVVFVLGGNPALAEEPGFFQRVGDGMKRAGQKIEDKTKRVVKKVEDKRVGDKVERKLKKAATKTAEGFEKAGKKINEKLN